MRTQNEYKIGGLGKSVFESELKQAPAGSAQAKIWAKVLEYNKSDPQVLSLDTDVHTAKMMREKYVFITDETLAQRLLNSDCSVYQPIVDEHVHLEWYAVGLQNNSAYRHAFNAALLQLLESDIVGYWTTLYGGGQPFCGDDDKPAHRPLDMKSLGGIFCLTGMCIMACFAVFACELFAVLLQHQHKQFTSRIHSTIKYRDGAVR